MTELGWGTQQDWPRAAQWYRDSISAGTSSGLPHYALAGMYRKGKGVPQDLTLAFEHYREAADIGRPSPYASYALAKMYQTGTGTLPDQNQADQYFVKALTMFLRAEQEKHDPDVQYRLGIMFLKGEGTTPDAPRAAEFLEISAKQKNPLAQYALGRLYLFGGPNLEKDTRMTQYWLTLSASAGNPLAPQLLNRIEYRQHQELARASNRLFQSLLALMEQPPQPLGIRFPHGSESKQKRKEKEKKIAQGHKADDQEPSA